MGISALFMLLNLYKSEEEKRKHYTTLIPLS